MIALARLRISQHPAIVAWLIGNEPNGFWNEYVCDDGYAELHLPHDHCVLGESGVELCQLVDSMCAIVKGFGFMCSTPFAGTSPPKQYLYEAEQPHSYGFLGWVQICEGTKRFHPWAYEGAPTPGVQHIDFWAANLYPGRDFGNMFADYATLTQRPLMVAEFGIDAYNTDCVGDDASVLGCEDQQAQAEWLMSLVEDIERHASACSAGCVNESQGQVTVGGAV